MMSVCMKRTGRSNRISIGGVDFVMGSTALLSSALLIRGMVPTPDDPTSVTCGGDMLASFGS